MVKACSLRLYLGIETVFCRLLQRMVRMDMEFKLEKGGPTFFFSQVLMPCLKTDEIPYLKHFSVVY